MDNINSASTALTEKDNAPEVPGFCSVAKCDNSGIKNTNKVVQIGAKNMDCTKLIKNSLDIYNAFASDHDPKKDGASASANGGGGAGASGGGIAGASAGGGT